MNSKMAQRLLHDSRYIFAVPLVVARFYALALNAERFSPGVVIPALLRGLLSDLAVGLVLSVVLSPLLKRKASRYIVFLFWTAAAALNVEHISFNHANADFRFAGLGLSREFLLGSVLSFRNLGHVILCLCLSLAVLYALGVLAAPARRLWAFRGVAAVFAITAALAPVTTKAPDWMQLNFAEENLRNLVSPARARYKVAYIDSEVRESFFGRDLSGRKAIKYPKKKPNVLILIIEAIGYHNSISDQLANLKEISSKGISFNNFLSLQHQTNRGLYTILCGDYPNLLSPESKSDIMGVYGNRRPCLPSILRQEGYKTVFMQSAMLGFMRKDRFTKQAGFQESIGSSSYPSAYSRTPWGVDDRTLYEYAIDKVKELRQGQGPWFLTMLTSSTHHPYNVPGRAVPTLEEALAFADDSFGRFMGRLINEGLLANTLVLITSDEVSISFGKDMSSVMSLQHAPLVVLPYWKFTPTIRNGLFTHVDIALSVADFVGAPVGTAIGRSVFRDYATGRDLLFGSAYSSRLFGYSRDGKLYYCTLGFSCSAYQVKGDGRLFGAQYIEVQPDADFISRMAQAAAYNELNSGTLASGSLYSEKNTMYNGTHMLLGQHVLQTRRNDIVIWELVIQAMDDVVVIVTVNEFQEAIISHVITDNIIDEKISVPAGQTRALVFEHREQKPLRNISSAIIVETEGQGGYLVKSLEIRKRTE